MKKIFVVSLLILFCITCVLSQDKPLSSSQKKLMARRAAIMDGYRQLAETIQGIKITSITTVKDFVTQDDTIKGEMNGFVLRGVQVVREEYLADGTYEVDMEVKLDDLIAFIEMAQGRYNYTKWGGVNIQQQMASLNTSRVIQAKGTGATPTGVDVDKLVVENETMKTELARLQIELARLQGAQLEVMRLQGVAKENEIMKAELAKLKAESEKDKSSLQLIFKLQQENSQLKQQLHASSQQLQNIQILVNSLRPYKDQYDSLLLQNRQLQDKLTELQNMLASYNEYKAKCEELTIKYQEASQKLTTLQLQVAKVFQLQAEVEKIMKEKNALQHQLVSQSELRNKVVGLERQNQKLADENNRLLSQIQVLEKEILEKKPYISQLEAEIARLKTIPQGVWVTATSQQRALARRAAIMDGYRLLLEAFQGVRIDSKTTVKDFVTENDQIMGETQGFIRGAQMNGERYLPDGTCEVEMTLDIDLCIRFLKQTARQYGADKWNSDRFNDVYRYETRKEIKVTGTGTFKQ